jgi:hypothetical protein
MEILNEIYNRICNNKSDINEHLPTLKKYSSECEHVTEMGVNCANSTFALMSGKPKRLISYDIEPVELFGTDREFLTKIANENGVDFSFIEGDTTKIEIEPTDCLFIDTEHNYLQLKIELTLHANKVKKYIIFHDTVLFANEDSNSYGLYHNLNEIEPGDNIKKGLKPAIDEFLLKNKNWVICEHFENNNGLTIIKKI